MESAQQDRAAQTRTPENSDTHPQTGAWPFVKDVMVAFGRDRAVRLAAEVSFYAALSFAPLVLLFFRGAGAIWDESASQQQLAIQIEKHLGPSAAQMIEVIVANASDAQNKNWIAWISIVVLIWSATSVFTCLQEAMNHIWNVEPAHGRILRRFLKKRLISLMLIVLVSILMAASIIITTVVSALVGSTELSLPGGDIAWKVFNLIVSIGLYTVFFGVIFLYLPDTDIDWKVVIGGALGTAVLFVIGKELLSFYMRKAAVGSAYGAAGSLMVLLVWVYYSTCIFFLGAEFTHCYARRRQLR